MIYLSIKFTCDTMIKVLDLFIVWFILTGDHPG